MKISNKEKQLFNLMSNQELNSEIKYQQDLLNSESPYLDTDEHQSVLDCLVNIRNSRFAASRMLYKKMIRPNIHEDRKLIREQSAPMDAYFDDERAKAVDFLRYLADALESGNGL